MLPAPKAAETPAPMDHETWLAERRKRITASDVAPILGIKSFRDRTAYSVFCEKAEILPPQADTPEMRLGRLLEPVVAQLYAEESGLELSPGRFIVRDEWMGGTPDRLIVGMKRGLEVKTAIGVMSHLWGEEGTDEVPDCYLTQCAWYMALTDLPEWDLAVLIGGHTFRIYHLKRDKKLEDWILKLTRRFYDEHLVPRVAPPIDGSRAAKDHMEQMFPREANDIMRPSTKELDELAVELARIHATQDAAKKKRAEIENKMKAVIGDANGLVGAKWKATWRKPKDTDQIDWEEVAACAGAAMEPDVFRDLIAKFTTPKENSRRFNFTMKEGKA